jgi:hypothetical protein
MFFLLVMFDHHYKTSLRHRKGKGIWIRLEDWLKFDNANQFHF